MSSAMSMSQMSEDAPSPDTGDLDALKNRNIQMHRSHPISKE